MSLSKIVKSINMTISGFTMVRNATKYYYPIKESIESILPIVDEYIIALGKGDDNDLTRKEIESIDSPKIKIIDRIWDEQEFIECKIYANETTFSLSQCSGDWCIYLQADEVIHENDLPCITKNCNDYLNEPSVDGFLFNYHHFFGDYYHYLPFHGWYKNEIRIVRNHKNIYSIKDAQSFRKDNNEKLNVVPIDAYIYHYGWVRPPESMQSKNKEQDTMYHGEQKLSNINISKSNNFDYGALGRLPIFKNSHPKVMDNFRAKISWLDQLNYSKKAILYRDKMKHEKCKYRLITFLENLLNGGRDFVGYTNWNIVKVKK
jgi:hypothetical protein